MSKPSRGADALVQTLQQAGVSHVFTLSGNHIMPVFDALFGSGIALIHTRHEAATVHMADAWSRITGTVGIAMVTGGPGHGNAVSALYTAQMAEAPIVLLSGHAPNGQRGMGAFQEMRQADMAAPVTKAAWVCEHADAVAADMARAIRIARSGRPGPVHLSLPSDALEAAVGSGTVPEASFAPAAQTLDASAARSLLERLREARRPLILTGPAAMTRPARALTAKLESACGIPVVGMESPRGIGDPSLGAFAEVLREADCVLLLGKRLDFTLKFGKAPAFARGCVFLQVDAEDNEIERTRRAVGSGLALAFDADVPSAMTQLIDSAPQPADKHDAWRAEVRAAIAYRPAAWDTIAAAKPSEVLHPVQALRPLQALLDSHPDSVFVSDGGEFGQWAQACLDAPHRVINGVAGSIGSAVPYALAARCAVPDAPVVAATGDGAFGFHLPEIDTAVR